MEATDWAMAGACVAVAIDLLAYVATRCRRRRRLVHSPASRIVLAGCAILEAVLRMWPCERLRVADRGLREGILTTLMSEDGVFRQGRRRRPRRQR